MPPHPLRSSPLLVTLLTTITLAGAAIWLALPLVAPDPDGPRAATLGVTVLLVLVVAMIARRLRRVTERGSRQLATTKVVTPWPIHVSTAGVLLLGLGATGLAVASTIRAIEHDARGRFEHLSERLVDEARRRVMHVRNGLTGARGVYAALRSVTREQFRAYVASRDLPAEFPGVIGFGFIQRVMRDDLEEFVAVERAGGAPDFTVRSLATPGSALEQTPDLYVVRYSFPEERNAPARGLDIGSEPVRREAIERAVRTGEATLSGQIRLAEDAAGQTGFLMLMPVYQQGTSPATPEQRLASLAGVVYAPILLEELLADVGKSVHGEIDFEIFDGETPIHVARLFVDLDGHMRGTSGTIDVSAFAGRMFHHTTTAPLAGRTWTFTTSTTPLFEAGVDRTTPAALGVLGTLLSLLLAGLVWTQGRGRAQALDLARSMTADLTAALHDARELAAAVDHHADCVFLADESGRITRVNPAFERLTGYSAAEAIGQSFESLRGSKTPTQVYEAIWAAIRAGQPWNGRLCHRRARREAGACRVRLPILGQDAGTTVSCEEYWVDASITPLRTPDGRVTGFVAIERDVTAAVAAEEVERHRSEAIEARYAVARVLDGMGDLATRLGDAVEITFNMKNMEVQKKGGVFLLEEGDTHLRMFVWRGQFSQEFLRDEAAVPLGRCLCGRAALSGEVIVSDNCFTDHRHENHWPNMKPHGHYIVPLMDRSTPGRTSCVGVMFLYTEVNPIATTERLNGLREIGELMALAILKERANRMLEKARAAAENANRAKSAFLANMSHEIRTPLTAILGYADLLREEESATISPEQRTQAIDTIRRAGQHLLTIINDILDLSKIEAGRMSVERIETPLLGVLREVESFMRVRAAAGGITLTTRLARPLPDRILSDPTRLRQILMNLVGNAVKFTEIGSVTITADAVERDGQSRLVIDVEDTGAGLTEEQASRLFEPFSQADASTTRRFGGTGLGLTICRRLANLMGGDVTLHRTQPGRGSCFRLELPLVPAPGAAMVANLDALTSAPAPAPSQPRVVLRGRILLAEDGPDNQRLIAFHLRNAGAEVTIADNGRIALEMIDRAAADGAPFDLLLTDMQMPEMDGYTLARTLRERGSTLPIIALTAHAMAEDRERCLQAGCDDFATKPIDKPALLATCARWMGRRDEARAPARAA